MKQAEYKKFIFIYLAYFSFISTTLAQVNCGSAQNTEPRWGLPYPVCNLDEKSDKCIRIKFHYINNTNGASLPPSDAEVFNLLEEVNYRFRTSKIRFENAGECVHHAQILPSGNPPSPPYSIANLIQWTDEGGPGGAPLPQGVEPGSLLPPELLDPDLDYTYDFLNVYLLQQTGFNIGLLRISSVFVQKNTDASLLVHEIGHVLGLNHTMGPFGLSQLVSAPEDCLCKKTTWTNQTGVRHCEVTGDCLCDTGIDPYSLDLDNDPNNYADREKWVINGVQIPELLPSIADWCGDVITPWKIPFRNYMSYYSNELTEFSPCQMALMHDILEELTPNLIVNCSPAICQDIIIDDDVVWTNEIKEYCYKQRIIIKRNGSLTLDGTTLTAIEPDIPPSTCPNFKPSKSWGGIVMDNVPYSDGGPGTPSILRVKNLSVIEFAGKAITSLNSFGEVLVENSTIRECRKVLDVRGSLLPFSPLPSLPLNPGFDYVGCSLPSSTATVNIYKSLIEIEYFEPLLPLEVDQLKLNGINLNLIGSTIKNNSSSLLTAINSIRGEVNIFNGSRIENFQTGIYKDIDIFNLCTPRGLYVYGSSILECTNAINNFSATMSLRKNFIEGDILSTGLSYQKIYANNINATTINLFDPQESVKFEENKFVGASLQIRRRNNFTNSLCNYWTISQYAVEIENNSEVIESWGDIDEGASGNIHDNISSPPIMLNYESDFPIVNFYRQGHLDELFSFIPHFSGKLADENNCVYGLYPTEPPIFISLLTDDNEDFESWDEEYEELDSLIQAHSNNLNTLTGNQAIEQREKIAQLKVKLKDLVRKSITVLESNDSAIAELWLERANPKILELTSYYSLLYTEDFEELQNLIENHLDSDANVLGNAVNYLKGIVNNVVTIHNLSDTQIDTLSIFAKSSFGDYTNILRAFLNAEYNIKIPWYVEIIPRGSVAYSNNYATSDRFDIKPNPTANCISITAKNGGTPQICVEVFNTQGVLVKKESSLNLDVPLCLYEFPAGIYLVRIRNSGDGYSELHKVIRQ